MNSEYINSLTSEEQNVLPVVNKTIASQSVSFQQVHYVNLKKLISVREKTRM